MSKRNYLMPVIDPKEFECVVCFEEQFESVYVCKKDKGHWICQKCFFKLVSSATGNKCPVCKTGLTENTTFYDLTKIFHGLQAECKYVDIQKKKSLHRKGHLYVQIKVKCGKKDIEKCFMNLLILMDLRLRRNLKVMRRMFYNIYMI